MGMQMEGFFDGADSVAEAIAFTSATAQGVPTEASIPSPKPIIVEESTQAERVGEFVPASVSQTRSASPATPLVILAINPFVALSQVVKDGFSLVVTHSSILSFTA